MSTQAKHTPGPWAIESAQGYSLPCEEFFLKIYSENPGPEHDFTVAFARNADPLERRANARLIASAPDLLNLLTAADRLEELTGENLAVYARTFAALARAAIAKAKGETAS